MQNYQNAYSEIELIIRAKAGDVIARNEVIKNNIPLIKKIVKK